MTESVVKQNSQNHFPKNIQEEEEEDYEKLPPITFLHKMTFALLGICSMTGWNAILNAFDFFQAKFPKKEFVNVAFYFPIPIMFTNFLISVTLTIIGHMIPIEKRIPFSLRGGIITLVSICLVGIFLQKTQVGIILVFIILVFQGTMDSITVNSSVALSGATQNRVLIVIFWNFTAWSGIIMNVLRLIALGAFGEKNLDKGTGLYFGVAATLYLIGSISIMKFKNGNYFKAVQKRDKIRNQKLQEQLKQIIPSTEKDIEKHQDNQIVIDNNNQIQTAKQIQTNQQIQTNYQIQTFQQIDVLNNKNMSFMNKILQKILLVGPAPFFIFICYVQSYMLFPGVSVYQKPKYTLIKFPFAPVFMFAIFNIGDLIGKSIGGIKFLQRQWLAFAIIFSRFAYFIIFIMVANKKGSKDIQNDIFQYFFLFIFAIKNGIVTSILFTVAPLRANSTKNRDQISYVCVFSLKLGIAIGSFMALILKKN